MGRLAERLGPGRIEARGLSAGSPCRLTSAPALESQWQRLAGQATQECTRGLRLRLQGRLGEPLELGVGLACGNCDRSRGFPAWHRAIFLNTSNEDPRRGGRTDHHLTC